ncbi:MAG TPA: DUF86 domain-containing protein [Candidatus Latescibacteria bacterium]|nr:DUF86 domain-containing protein [Candidatus Latescibacterota bacterium]
MAKLDTERILSKIDERDSYLEELRGVTPKDFKEYQQPEKRRSCERLLQITIEVVIDICNLFVSGLRLGLPSEENDLFEKLRKAGIITEEMEDKVEEMRAFRNILVYEYAHVDDSLVYKAVKEKLGDFSSFKKEVLEAIKSDVGKNRG